MEIHTRDESAREGDTDAVNTSGQSPLLSTTLGQNLRFIRQKLSESGDLTIQNVQFGHRVASIITLDGLNDIYAIQKHLVQPLQLGGRESVLQDRSGGWLDEIETRFISLPVLKRTNEWDEIVAAVLAGDAALLLDGEDRALLIKSRNPPGRAIEEPKTEALVRGPREGFTENISANMTLVRKQIRDPNLTFDTVLVGRRSRQTLAVAYIDGIAHPEIVKEVKRRLESLDVDAAPESGTIEQWIEDSFLSPFPQILHTERPDKVALLLEGTPFVLLLPTTLVSLIQSPEDYYERWIIGSLIRTLRYAAVLVTLLLPALYVALISFHQGMIPFKLAFSIAATREGVPFPAVVEALLMEGTFELLREAGIRLPKPIGQTIGIVGGLVIGEAAVQAGIVSPVMVIIVSITAISSFAIPAYSVGIAFRILRFAVILAASIFGLYGIVLAMITICIHLLRLYSFGVPYSAPYAPTLKSDWRDLFIRAPITLLTGRPRFMQTKNPVRADKEGEP